jgi:hypothetical protein
MSLKIHFRVQGAKVSRGQAKCVEVKTFGP